MLYGYDSSFIFKGYGVNLSFEQQKLADQDRLYESPQNISIIKEMAKDMYKRIIGTKYLSNTITINFANSKKTNQGFLITGGVQDPLFVDKNDTNDSPFHFTPIESQYLIYDSGSNNWSWKFILLKQ